MISINKATCKSLWLKCNGNQIINHIWAFALMWKYVVKIGSKPNDPANIEKQSCLSCQRPNLGVTCFVIEFSVNWCHIES